MVKRMAVIGALAAMVSAAAMADVSMVEQRHVGRVLGGQNKAGDKKKPSPPSKATGSQALIDASGVKYFINTNITFSTSSSAASARNAATTR